MATTYRRKPTKAEIRRQKMEELVMFPIDWLEERSGLIGGLKYFLFRNVPSDINWMQTLGSAALTAFLVQAITGVILAMYYVPSADINPRTGKPIAWESIVNITDHLTLGWLVRGMHKWGASVFIILMFLHMGRVFLFGAYKYPRELNWIIGVLILVNGMMEGFTGYLLPWDQTAYWA
jgi:ubiquinol-cytochrome c reductase cytochrome b subunit/menaquinol-cytochrome c reductase cytochrome b subunit